MEYDSVAVTIISCMILSYKLATLGVPWEK